MTISRPGRWDNPFDADLSEADIDRIMDMDLFRKMDTSKFSDKLSLRDIIRNDTRIQRFRSGDIIVRTGDYGTTAFLIVSGSIRVVLPPPDLPETLLGRASMPRKGVFEALSQLWRNPAGPEVRDPTRLAGAIETSLRTNGADKAHVFIRDVPAVLDQYRTVRPEPGSLFGEIAALTRAARTTCVFAEDNVELVEIRRQGIRDIRQRVDSFRKEIDDMYRRRSLRQQLREAPIFRHLSEEVIGTIAAEALFETYGDFDWHISYNRYLESSAKERLAMEPIIAREGDYPDGLLIIASGSARVTCRLNHGQKTLRYDGVGAYFGFEEIAQNWRDSEATPVPLQHTLRAVGYTDVLRVPTAIIEEYVLPNLPPHLAPDRVERRRRDTIVAVERRASTVATAPAQPEIDTDTLEILVEHRFIKGTATMLIDLDRCVRCDACVDACAKGHNNNPRFIRHGYTFDHFMVANACMHCTDPVCMIGCPTGAINRDALGGQVVINDKSCIGCGTCATNCPYNNIRMVEIRDGNGSFIRDGNTFKPIAKATKCDLCLDQPGGPACQRACPHDALRRFDMKDRPRLAEWLNR